VKFSAMRTNEGRLFQAVETIEGLQGTNEQHMLSTNYVVSNDPESYFSC